jgi:hypothetical protein
MITFFDSTPQLCPIPNFDVRFVDKFGFITPQPVTEDKPADNAVLFLSVASILGYEITKETYKSKVRECYLKKGLVARWPGNNFDQSAWDDYLGIAVASIIYGDTEIPREVLSYAFDHVFFFNTDGKLQFKDFLGRHVHVWLLMFAAAYPDIQWMLKPLLKLCVRFFDEPVKLLFENDSSGYQLQFVYLFGLHKLGIKTDVFDEHTDYLWRAFELYYHKEHPFNKTLDERLVLSL